MLKVGDTAPEIDAETSKGTRFVLSKQRGLCTILYFFPKAFTPGCTAETKRFRDNFIELEIAGANLVGVSTDDLKTQCDFASSTSAPFPMIGDADGAIGRAYDVLWPVLGVAQRVTYVVGPNRLIEAVFHHELNVKAHRDDVLRFVDEKFRSQRPPDRPSGQFRRPRA
ncbi:MAG: peroxiredoxin [Byssovorax sp.]